MKSADLWRGRGMHNGSEPERCFFAHRYLHGQCCKVTHKDQFCRASQRVSRFHRTWQVTQVCTYGCKRRPARQSVSCSHTARTLPCPASAPARATGTGGTRRLCLSQKRLSTISRVLLTQEASVCDHRHRTSGLLRSYPRTASRSGHTIDPWILVRSRKSR